jgi:adenine deaminase
LPTLYTLDLRLALLPLCVQEAPGRCLGRGLSSLDMRLGDSALTDELLRELPKAELHIHIEGSLEPEMMFEMAARNSVSLRYGSVQEVREAYDFSDLQSFLDLYYEGERRLGISSQLIMCFLRHLSAEEAMETLRQALPYKDSIVGVGLDASEVNHPPEDFEAVFEDAGRHGFRKVAHAGEEGPPEYIRQALDDLGAARIDHGVRCVEDPGLVRRPGEEQVPLTVCPLSNVRLRVVDSMVEHPLKRMLGEGLCVTVNSDDPAYFGGCVADNYSTLRDGLGYSRQEFRVVTETSFKASFLSEDEKKRLLEELGSYFEM